MFAFQKMRGQPPFSVGELEEQNRAAEEFKEVCRPVVEYIQKNYTPHTRVIIDWASAILLSEEMGTPYQVPD